MTSAPFWSFGAGAVVGGALGFNYAITQRANYLRDTYHLSGREANAVAHALASAELARIDPDLAKMIGDARELWSALTNPNNPQMPYENFQDLWNNQIGRQIGEYASENHLTSADIENLAIDAVRGGDLISTRNDPRFDPSFDGYPQNFNPPADWHGPGQHWNDPPPDDPGDTGFSSDPADLGNPADQIDPTNPGNIDPPWTPPCKSARATAERSPGR
jgi:hypothetical protein